MTDKTRVVAVRLPNDIADWLEAGGSARHKIEEWYEDSQLDFSGVKSVCDKYDIDYQLALDRMEQLMREDMKG